MGLGPSIQLRQSQQLVMTPQLTQAIKLLTLSNLELESVIAEEVAKNPLLEVGAPEDPESAAEGEAESASAPSLTDELIPGGGGEDDRPLDYDFTEQALETDSYSDVAIASSGSGEAFDFERIEATATSLSEHLLAQLHGSSGPAALLAEIIVEQLDENGYLTTALADVAADAGASMAEAEEALRLVQDLDPPGVGARNLAECLALQAKAVDRYDPAMARLIDNLELLAKGRMGDLRRICGVDEEDLADMVRELRGYDPKPGSAFSSGGVEQVAPDVFVRRLGNGYSVELNSAALPRLLVNRRYYQELRSGPQDKGSKAWLSECLASANWLVRALDQRARTIVRVVGEIVKTQAAFFERGPEALRPLTLRQVADAGAGSLVVPPTLEPEPFAADYLDRPALYAPLTFMVGASRTVQPCPGNVCGGNQGLGAEGGVEYAAREVVAAAPEGDGVRLTLSTSDPSGRRLEVTITPGPGDAMRLRAVPRPSAGVVVMSDAFGATQSEAFRGFGGRHNAIDQRGEAFYNWPEQENSSNEGAAQVAGRDPETYQFANGPQAAYSPQALFYSSEPYGFLLNQTDLSYFRMASDRPSSSAITPPIASPRNMRRSVSPKTPCKRTSLGTPARLRCRGFCRLSSMRR